MRYRYIYALYGICAGAGVPFGWLLWRAFSTRKRWWMTWIENELEQNSGVYLTLIIGAISLLWLIGYLIGHHRDELNHETETIKDSNLELEMLATTDSLTGLFNARYLRDRLNIDIENSHRSPLSCLLIDLDHFKKINDQYGHPVGDEVLVHLAKIMRKAVRRVDIVGRLGGEEFLVILPDTSADRANEIAERIRNMVQTEIFELEDTSFHLTVSIGLATALPENLLDGPALLKAVDKALYAAKKSGRNRISVHQNQSQ